MGFFDFFKKTSPQVKAAPVKYPLLEMVAVAPGVELPKAFISHWPAIRQTKLLSLKIKSEAATDLSLEQSKFGYYPCMPLDFEYPKDNRGDFMYPLAQINCSEMPPLEGYPTSGYLQFYISVNGDVFGLDFSDPQLQADFRVLFFEESAIDQYKADFSFLDSVMTPEYCPIDQPYALSFSLQEEYIGAGDVRYEQQPGNLDKIAEQFPEITDELIDEIQENFHYYGHKIGGYAHFAQEDPRLYNDQFKDYVLLLQIDSDDNIMWGDSGVGNFFIHPNDLAKKDFSKVMYNWDCY